MSWNSAHLRRFDNGRKSRTAIDFRGWGTFITTNSQTECPCTDGLPYMETKMWHYLWLSEWWRWLTIFRLFNNTVLFIYVWQCQIWLQKRLNAIQWTRLERPSLGIRHYLPGRDVQHHGIFGILWPKLTEWKRSILPEGGGGRVVRNVNFKPSYVA
jgi:hypothetical protein